jgi:hypothetical protein
VRSSLQNFFRIGRAVYKKYYGIGRATSDSVNLREERVARTGVSKLTKDENFGVNATHMVTKSITVSDGPRPIP